MPDFSITDIWLPQSFFDKDCEAVNRALQAYDARVHFGLNQATGDWCAFYEMPRGSNPQHIPILGFGKRIPSPDEAVRRLHRADTVKHGMRIFTDMEKHNRQLRKEREARVSEQTAIAVEGLESFLHAQGATPYHRSLPKKDPKQRGYSAFASRKDK